MRRPARLRSPRSARVSKRELYALVGNKQEMLIACISARARRLQVPADFPVPHDRETLAHVLASFGTQLVREITDPTVIAVFRLAIAEAVHAPEVAQALDSIGRETSRAALRQIMAQAQASGLLSRPSCRTCRTVRRVAVGQFDGQPAARRRQATEFTRSRGACRDATAAFLQLHPLPSNATPPRRR